MPLNRYLLCYRVSKPVSNGSWADGHVFTSLEALTESALADLAVELIAGVQKDAPGGSSLNSLVWISCTKLDPET